MRSTEILSVLATTVPLATAASYVLKDDLSYKNFFANFELFSQADPTKGFVQYQNITSATANEYIGYLDDTKSIYLGVDHKTKDPKGRASVRLESTKSWNQGLLIADIRHMPDSVCGTWPAFWLLGTKTKWPLSGEIDILEGVNDYDRNAATLHTGAGCSVDNKTSGILAELAALPDLPDLQEGPFTGHLITANCDVAAPNQPTNMGCSIKAPASTQEDHDSWPDDIFDANVDANIHKREQSKRAITYPSYGTHFNAAGGGIYAMEWTSSYIAVWFFPRGSPTHTHLSTGESASRPDPPTWGTPFAKFQGRGCDFAQKFRDQKVIFNITFCGDWAGGEWSRSCAATTGVARCEEYVRENPEAFEEAYWEVQTLQWFERGGALEGGREKKHGMKDPNAVW